MNRFARFQACVHLTNHAVYPLLLFLGLLSLPSLWILEHHPETEWLFRAATLLVVASFGHPWFYLTAQRAREGAGASLRCSCPWWWRGTWASPSTTHGPWWRRSWAGPANSIALPNTASRALGKLERQGLSASRLRMVVVEVVFARLRADYPRYAAACGHYLAVPFLLLYGVGAGTFGGLSLWSAWTDRGARGRAMAALAAGSARFE